MSTQTYPPDDPRAGSDGDESFERTVAFEKTDAEEQIATGAVLVPDELDHQLDYFRADLIRDLAEDYEERFENGDVYGGVMHSVFPGEGVELDESRVLDDAETIGDEHYPEGTWVQSYKFADDELWALVEDGILRGNSIGGTAKGRITDPIPDDVRVPDDVADGVPDDVDPSELPGRQITEGRILEVSAVDHPAVPRATHEEHKAASLQKGHPALTGSVVEARLYLESRGHSPDEAKRLAEYLQTHKAAAEDVPGGGGILARMKALIGRGSGGESSDSRTGESGRGAAVDLHELMDEDEFQDVLKDIQTTQDELNERMDALDTDTETGGSESAGGDTTEIKLDADGEGDGETVTLTADGDLTDDQRAAIESALNGEADDDDPDRVDELASKVDDLADTTQTTNELVLRMADANGVSQQADTEDAREKGDDGLDGLAEMMG